MATGWGPAGAATALDAAKAVYVWIQAHVGDPGAAGTANPAAETTRQQVTWGTVTNGAMSNSATLTWTNVAGSEDWTHFTAHSASTAGNFGWSGTITANPVAVGDTLTFAAGALTTSVTLAT